MNNKTWLSITALWLLLLSNLPAHAQRVLSLDSCRALALQNNKQLRISELNREVALNTRKAVRTKYLPKVDAMAGYEHFSKEVSLLNRSQKSALSNIGTTAGSSISNSSSAILTQLVQQGLVSPDMAQQLGSMLGSVATPLAQAGNEIGQSIRDAFRTDTRNMWAGAVMLRQPIYMGGAIAAVNRVADISEQLAENDHSLKTQNTLYDIDQAYWLVVSLRQKQRLANSYRDLVRQLDDDVHKMINEGVATRADGLKVDVKVNEADMQITQVDDGLALSRMLLCQLCGLPMDEAITLTDEGQPFVLADQQETATALAFPQADSLQVSANRPELRMLQNSVDMSQEATKIIQAEYRPHVALTAGYLISNPNVFNGFERKFSGVWNIGVVVQVPVWNWFEGAYKVRASRAATSMAQMELSDAQEKIELQVSQCRFKVTEAWKKLSMARQNIKSAEENLRCANLGFREGVMDATDVMAAQTAWQQAQSQKIDAEIDVKLAQVNLQKALGTLQ